MVVQKQGRHPANSRKRWAGALMEVRSLFCLNSAVRKKRATDHGPRTTDHGPRTTYHGPRTTDRPTNGRTYGWTDPNTESLVRD